MNPTLGGIVLGLAAAACQSLTYLQSRHYVQQRRDGRLRLLLLGHLVQAVVCAALLPVLWPANMPPLRQYALPLVVESLGYLAGQACLFVALRHAEASRVAPILGLKVAMLALASVLFFQMTLSGQQWAAVVLAVAAAFVLNWTGGQLAPRATLGVLGACIGYSVSDLYIKVLIDQLHPVTPMHAALVGMALSYVVCGLAVLPLLLVVRNITRQDVQAAIPYGLTWLASMGFFYASLAWVGVVLAGIAQSTRGIISIGLGYVLARLGWEHLETRAPAHAVLRRAAAAALMSLAIALYVLGQAKS